jgi:precorrin-3B C17-methyltransferase
VTTLAAANPAAASFGADMATLVIIGSAETRLVERENGRTPLVYTPRAAGWAAK